MIGWLMGELWPLIAGAVVAAGALFAAWRAGRKGAQADHRAKTAEDYTDTRKRIDHGTRGAGTGTDDDIRKRLRERAKR
jgi:hypothetical protein